MGKPLIIEPEAEADLQQAWLWYELQRRGLGDDFSLCIEATLIAISERPASFPQVHRRARRALVHRFPYLILFRNLPEAVIVLGVFHTARNPKLWKRRARG